jgi:hypothetical protein
MLPFPLENNLFLLSSETLDGVVLLRHPHCSPVRPRSVLTPGAWAHTSSHMAIPYPRFTIIRTFERSSTRLPRAAPRSAAPYSQTAASSDGSPPGQPDRFPPAQSQARSSRHSERAPPQESSSPSGMAAIADGELGTQHRSQHGPVVRVNPEREAAPGNGLPLLSRYHSPGAAVLPATHGSRGGTGITRPGLPLSEREVDLEELARRGSLISTTTWLPTPDP